MILGGPQTKGTGPLHLEVLSPLSEDLSAAAREPQGDGKRLIFTKTINMDNSTRSTMRNPEDSCRISRLYRFAKVGRHHLYRDTASQSFVQPFSAVATRRWCVCARAMQRI